MRALERRGSCLSSTHSVTIPASRYTQYTANGSTLPSRIRLKFVRIPVITLNESTMASMVAKSFMGSAVASSAPKVFHASASLHCVVRPRRNACLSARGADHGMQAASFRPAFDNTVRDDARSCLDAEGGHAAIVRGDDGFLRGNDCWTGM